MASRKPFFASLLSLTLLLGGCGDILNIPELGECPASRGGDLSQHTPGADGGTGDWQSWGGNLENTRHAANETLISPANVSQLQTQWIYTTAGSVSATPTITDNTLYITDWGQETTISGDSAGGKVHAVRLDTGAPLWSKWMRVYNNDTLNNISRSSPAIFEDMIIIADVQNPAPFTSLPSLLDRTLRYMFNFGDPCGAYVYGINRHTSKLVWSTRIGSQMFDQVTQSPVVYNDTVFVGLSSNESTYTRSQQVPCCKFRGMFFALDAHTGTIKWDRPMIEEQTTDPDEYDLFAGAAVWGGAPTIDPERNSVYLPTGNNYWVPVAVQNSLLVAGPNLTLQNNCMNSSGVDNYFDSIVSLDMDTGAVNWVKKSRTYDAWTTACDFETLFPLLAFGSSTANCPTPYGPDSDFAQPPMLVRDVDIGGGDIRDVLYAGTKGGRFYAIDADDGSQIWSRQVGPGGLIGGMQFGAATDGQRIYVQNTNFGHVPYMLEAGPDAGKVIQSGFWAALDPANGNLLWQTQVPGGDNPLEGSISHLVWGSELGSGFFAWPMAALTVANGVVFAGVANLEGTMAAMDASNGQILWQMDTGQSIGSGPSIVNGNVFWGTGYRTGNRGNRLYKLGLP